MIVLSRKLCKQLQQCCKSFCDSLCSERVLSPIVVLSVHGLLVADVMYHRTEIWSAEDTYFRSIRILVVATVLCYLRTSLTDPGFLRASSRSSNQGEVRLEESKGTFGIEAALFLCCAAAMSMSEWRARQEELRLAKTATGNPIGASSNAEDSPMANGKSAPAIPSRNKCSDPEVGGDLQGHNVNVSDAVDVEQGLVSQQGLKQIDADVFDGPKRRRLVPDDEGDDLLMRPRWCKRCKLYQPLRTKHCHDCGRCVRTHDHHCPWIGSCVGERNRVLFYWFLLLQSVELLVFFLEGVQAITLQDPSVVLMVGLLIIVLFFMMVVCLFCFHSFLLIANLTTWEHVSWKRITYLRTKQPEKGSPFGRSIIWNMFTYCCGPFWCPSAVRRPAALRYDDDGGIIWEMTEARSVCCILQCCVENC
eukprot:TRINITY_DN27933_c0_g1_i1.p1 TRINITY_DN27933_c0_g1~~TRINITY_DN27933_c0_g1_i1.p1  ORF type:complete len:419 (+),score=28.37 TRINITY_DN27933_c0_g1_i1:101-1357(+)